MTDSLGLTLNWQQTSDKLQINLAEGELHLWWLPLHLSTQQSELALELLSDIQRDKYHRRATEELKQSYLAGRFYLLHLLGHYTQTPANEVLLSYSQLNKPYLSDSAHAIEFNFTDTTITTEDKTTYGLFAFCKDRSVGVDLESIHRPIDFSSIAKKRFSTNELSYVTQANGDLNTHRCLAIWTRKEAFGKATGKGINFKMNQLDLANSGEFTHAFNAHEEDWYLQQIKLDANLISCVVHQGNQPLEIKAFKSANHIP